MLSLFRTNQLFLGVFLLIYASVLRFWPFLPRTPSPEQATYSLLSGWLYERLAEPVWLIPLAMTLLVWIQAMVLNGIIARERLAIEINLFPGLFYILVVSILPDFLWYSPVLVGHTFLVLSVGELFRTYKVAHCMDKLFNAGLLVGMASLFYSPYIVFLLPVLIGMNSLRAFRLREWLSVLIGGGIPILWLLIIAFLQDKLGSTWQSWVADFGLPGITAPFSIRTQIGLGILVTLLLVVLFQHRNFMLKTVIEVRKKINILYTFLLFSLLFTAFSDNLQSTHLLILGLPIGALISFFFTRLSRPASELVHLFLWLSILAVHYLAYLQII